jgi:hypothetical protein
MAQDRRTDEPASAVLDVMPDDTDLDTATPVPIEMTGDLGTAARRAAAEQRRLVVRDGGEEIAAVIPIADLRLLLRLEEDELDRIDRREAQRALDDPNNYPAVPWEQVKREAGL